MLLVICVSCFQCWRTSVDVRSSGACALCFEEISLYPPWTCYSRLIHQLYSYKSYYRINVLFLFSQNNKPCLVFDPLRFHSGYEYRSMTRAVSKCRGFSFWSHHISAVHRCLVFGHRLVVCIKIAAGTIWCVSNLACQNDEGRSDDSNNRPYYLLLLL